MCAEADVVIECTGVGTTADPAWLERLITRRVPLERWKEALERRPE